MAKPTTVAEYLAAAPAKQRAALRKVRAQIKAAAPDATEGLAYGIAGFKHRGKPLIYYGYAKGHCALYGGAIGAHAALLAAYDVSKGTLRFQPERPLPARLVAKLVKARIAEIEGSPRSLLGRHDRRGPGG